VLVVATHSATAALERLASSIAIAEELKLGAVRQEIPVPPALRHVRFIYFNPVDGSLKVCIVRCVFGLVPPSTGKIMKFSTRCVELPVSSGFMVRAAV
jgi:hypothetical protein